MDNSSDESDISESEIEEYSEKPYTELRSGKWKVKNKNGSLKCPFCAGKKQRDYQYRDLMQHASGVARGSVNRREKQKAEHLALEKYLAVDLASEAKEIIPRPQPPPDQDLYVWPWTGIIVNINSQLLDNGYWMKEFGDYRPIDIRVFLEDRDDMIGQAVVNFNSNWDSFKDAIEFDKSFDSSHHGKKDWRSLRDLQQAGSNIYGWIAREDDYNIQGPLGEYLRSNKSLRTVSDVVQEASQSNNNTVDEIYQEMVIKEENLKEMEHKYVDKAKSLREILEEKEQLEHNFIQKSRNIQLNTRKNVQRILAEQERLSNELEGKRNKLKSWSRDLDRREVRTAQQKQELEEELKKSNLRHESLLSASREQKIANDKVLKLADQHKREKEEALKKILQLQRDLDAKQKLEMEIEELKGKLEVMKHLEDKDNAAVQSKIKEMNDELEEKKENLEEMENMNETLIIKEAKSKEELKEARQELIEGFRDTVKNPRANIGLKRMGELDLEVFVNICKERFPLKEAAIKGDELCSLWQNRVKYLSKLNIIEEDKISMLRDLRQEWGEEICSAVVTAAKELNEYNASSRYTDDDLDLWNFKEKRKATLKEVIIYIVNQINKQQKKSRR